MSSLTSKPMASAQDVEYFDRILAKRSDIRAVVMPEYFSMPSWWAPTVKPKAGESAAERQIRDWTSWRKSYARTFRDKGLIKIDGILFYAAKITPGVFVALCKAGKRAYCLEYARQFGTDEVSFAGLIGLDSCYPSVMTAIRAANEYHRAKRSDKSSKEDVSKALDAYRTAFDTAHELLRAIDTSAAESAPVAAAPKTVKGKGKAIRVKAEDRAPVAAAPVVVVMPSGDVLA